MSRESWYAGVRQKSASFSEEDEEQLWQALQHRKLEGRTSDPEAAEYDEAADIFFQGIQLARHGDLTAGCAQIATAYLLDGRSINFVGPRPKSSKIQALTLDLELLAILSQSHVNDIERVSYGGHVLRVLLGNRLGNDPHAGQDLLATAMVSLNYLLQRVREQPELGDHHRNGGILGGCIV